MQIHNWDAAVWCHHSSAVSLDTLVVLEISHLRSVASEALTQRLEGEKTIVHIALGTQQRILIVFLMFFLGKEAQCLFDVT